MSSVYQLSEAPAVTLQSREPLPTEINTLILYISDGVTSAGLSTKNQQVLPHVSPVFSCLLYCYSLLKYCGALLYYICDGESFIP